MFLEAPTRRKSRSNGQKIIISRLIYKRFDVCPALRDSDYNETSVMFLMSRSDMLLCMLSRARLMKWVDSRS